MRLIEKLNQLRRDFTGIYECEGCHEKEERGGCYDDDYFHSKVMPNEKCGKCGKSTNDLGIESEKVATKYPEYRQV